MFSLLLSFHENILIAEYTATKANATNTRNDATTTLLLVLVNVLILETEDRRGMNVFEKIIAVLFRNLGFNPNKGPWLSRFVKYKPV